MCMHVYIHAIYVCVRVYVCISHFIQETEV